MENSSNTEKILLPGWGVAVEEYQKLHYNRAVDYGFFSNENHLNLMNPNKWLDATIPKNPYILIAHSMGSLFALRNSQLRDKAMAIIIIGGFAKFAKSDDNPYGKSPIEPAIMQKQLKRNPELLLKGFYQSIATPEEIKFSIPKILNVKQLADGLELLKICDIRNDLKDIRIPIHLLHGADDVIVSVKLAEYLHASTKGSSLKIIEGAGHALPFTQNERINEIIEQCRIARKI